MTLPKNTLLAIVIVLTGLMGGLYAVSSTILLNSLRQTEEQNTRRTVAGVLGAFDQTQADIKDAYSTWAAWDDTYAFVENGNQNFINLNFNSDALALTKIDLAVITNSSGKLMYGIGFDRIHHKKTPIPETLKLHLSLQDRLLQHSHLKSSLEGVMLVPEGAMILTSLPIVTTKGEGPIRGTMIIGRLLDTEEIARLSKIARLPLTVHGLNAKLPPDFQAVRNQLLVSNSIVVRPLNEKIISGYALIPDIYGKPAVLLRVDVPRDAYRQGQISLNYLSKSLLMLGLVFTGVILLLLRQLILFQRQQQQSEKRYRTLVTQTAEGIFLVDANTKQIVETNAAFENLLGYKPKELCKLTLNDIVADSDIVDLQSIVSQQQFAGEQQYRRLDGQLVDVEVNINLISHDDKDVFCIIVHDITQRKLIEEQLLHDAFHDSLTGLANRALFMSRLYHSLQLTKRCDDYTFAVLFLDLDRFKVINDSLGHMVGDQLLIAIAQRLQTYLRCSDTFARLGGDEFALLVENSNNTTAIVDRVQQELHLPFNLNGQEIFATASIGVILNTKDYERPEDLLRDADTAMYRAKAGGRARHQVFDISMHDQVVTLLHLENDLRRTIDNQELQLHYQPIVSLASEKIVGFEALVRWQHPTRGFISPTEFIPLAEDTGLIVPLGRWVLREACYQLRTWQMQFAVPLTISVNLSVKQFAQINLVEQISQVLNETNLDPSSLKVELTESLLMEPESATSVLLQLKALGVCLSLDDFGTGYSSLNYLHRFPIDILKIDRSFISINNSSENRQIVRAIAMLADSLGMDVIAEGVETKEQLAQLKALKCKYGQGYLFSKPVDSTTAANLILSSIHQNNSSPCVPVQRHYIQKETAPSSLIW